MSSIRLKRSAQAGKVPAVSQLQLGELAVNTHDGKVFFRRDREGLSTVREIGARDKSDNVYYVTKNGSDENDGKTIGDAFATLSRALSVAEEGSTVYVKSGTHIVDNPVIVPPFVAIVGDSLRTSIVKAKNKTEDIFWVKNGAFIKDLRITGHEAPAAGVAFPVGGKEVIYTSPYVQNCTSDTSTGTGMRIDGNDAEGLKSMVVDAYTQYNQGGIGIHHLNGGNTQLVSVFTICCDIAILCESGGFCSLTNSNSSFGNKGLVSDGLSPPLYIATTGTVQKSNSLIINNLKNIPYLQNAVQFSGGDEVYTVLDATPLKIGQGVLTDPDFSFDDSSGSDLFNSRAVVLDQKSVIQKSTIDFINTTYPSLQYNRSKCFRDVGLIIDSVLDDMIFDTNYRTVVAARSYYRASAGLVISDQQAETVAAIEHARDEVLALLDPGVARNRVEANFNVITDVILNGLDNLPAIVFTNPSGVLPEVVRAKNHLINNRNFLIAEATAFISINYPDLVYDQAICERDIAYILDGVTYDILYRGNKQSFQTGFAYYVGGVLQIPEEQKNATSDAIAYLGDKINDVFRANAVLSLQSTVPQDTTESAATINEINRGNTLFRIVQSVVRKGYFISDFIEKAPQNFELEDALALEIRETILSNKEKLQVDTIKFINKNFSEFDYNEEICSRDVGFILEAVAMDAALGTNYNAVIAGLSYQRANLAIAKVRNNQFVQTINAIKFVKRKTLMLDLSTLGASRVEDAFDTIIDIFENNDPQALTFPAPSPVDQNLVNARDQLLANREFIKAEIIAYINDEFQNFDYDQDKCSRDLDLILDAVLLDLVLGTNYNSIVAGEAYYRANASDVLTGQKVQTLGALKYFKNLIANIETIGGSERLQLLARLDTVISIFKAGPGTVGLSYTVNPSTATQAQINAKVQLDNNRLFLQKEVVAYVNQEFPSLVYDQEKCERDVGFIVSAIAHDILFGGNFATINAAEAYFVGAVGQLGEGEAAATVDSYEHLKAVIAQVIIGQVIEKTPGNTQVQVLSTTVATSAEATVLGGLIDLIILVINDGNTLGLPAKQLPDFSWSAQALQDTYAAVEKERTKLNDATILYINTQYRAFVYDQDKCGRDLGLILDAVALDAALGTNYNTLTAGLAYYRANAADVIDSQKEATISSLEFFRESIVHLTTVSLTFKKLVLPLVDEIINIVDTGTPTLALVYNNPGNATRGQRIAKDNLIANKAFIVDEIIAFINDNSPPVGYDEAKCERDVGLIIDGLVHDILYGTTYATVLVADSYFVGVQNQLGEGETAATIAAYEYLKSVVSDVIQNIVVTPTGGHNDNVQDTSGKTGDQTEADTLADLIDIIIGVLNDESLDNLPVPIFPDLTWAGTTIQTEFNDLRMQKQNLIVQTINFINKNFRGFVYDQAKCARDVGFIVEALVYDLLYGGNSASRRVAVSYFSQFDSKRNISQLGDGEVKATLASYRYLTTVAGNVIRGIAVTPTTGNSETQDTSSGNATIAEADRIATLVQITIKVLEEGTANNVVHEDFPSITWTASGLQLDFDLIRTKKKLIQSGTIEFIDNRYKDFNYDQFKCSRDVGLILEAVLDDMVLGTNYKSVAAGTSYYRASASAVIDDQLLETVESIKFLKSESLNLIIAQLASSQYTDLADRFDDVINILANGIDSNLPVIEFNPSQSTTQAQLDAVAILQANKNFFVEEAVAFISDNFPMIGYDRSLCERDVGLIIDAISYDLMFGSNYRTISAARSYFRKGARVVIDSQKEATLAAYELLRELAVEAVTDIGAKISIRTNMDLLIQIVNDGPGSDNSIPETYTIPTPISGSNNASDAGYLNARNNIDVNREFIIEEVIASIDNQLVYDELKCREDLDFILDALYYDLTYGGNLETTVAAKAYFSKAVAQLGSVDEKTATLAAYQYLSQLVESIARDAAVLPTEQLVVAQTITGNAGSTAAATFAENRILEIRAFIDGDGLIAITEIVPDTTWVAAGLLTANTELQSQKATIQTQVTEYVEAEFAYKENICRRDVGLIIDAICYDITYGGNTQIIDASNEYFSGGVLQIPAFTVNATRKTFDYIRGIAADAVQNVEISALQNIESQVTNLDPAGTSESLLVREKFKVLVNLLTHGYSSIVTFDTRLRRRPKLNETATFHQTSLITASGHTFEWVGAGVNINSALPYQGGQPIEENQVIELNNGKVYFTSTDQKGDFKIGPDLTIERASGTITGEAFDRSLFAVLTPYILSLQ